MRPLTEYKSCHTIVSTAGSKREDVSCPAETLDLEGCVSDQHVRRHVCSTCATGRNEGAMSEQQFSDLVAACEGELQSKQALFQHRIEGCKRWRYNLDDCTLTIDEIKFDITPIGTYSSSYGTWLWGWANEDFPAAARSASKELLAGLHQLTGWQVFHDPGIHASPADAVTFSALAVHMLDGAGLFRDSAEDGLTLYLAVKERYA